MAKPTTTTPIRLPGDKPKRKPSRHQKTNAGVITFFVAGIPAPGGSKKAFRSATTGKIIVLDDCQRNGPWRDRVAGEAYRAMGNRPPLDGPLLVTFTFVMPRPRHHFGTGKNANKIKASAPPYPSVAPDTTKLVRSTEDALKSICWDDDSQIVCQCAGKEYGNRPGVQIMIRGIDA